jgi:hypothetical protein
MDFAVDFINGISVGAEYVPAESDDEVNTFVIDIVLLRLLFQWE